jgi:peptide-methionine (R)-S-oxide reductase
MPTRRQFAIGAATIAAGALGVALINRRFASETAHAGETFEVNHTPEEWKKLLTPEQYAVLREGDTERPFSSPPNHETRRHLRLRRLRPAAL